MGASESKLAFKQSIFLLAGQDDISPTDPLWAQFYTLPESAEDVFALWSPHDLRNLTLNTPDLRPPLNAQIAPRKNLETLIYTTIARLRTLQTQGAYVDTQANVSPEIVNCIRILTRLFPYVYEVDHLRDWQESFFWRPQRPTRATNKSDGGALFYYNGLSPQRKFTAGEADTDIGPPLGEILLESVINYLFFPGFTLPKRIRSDGSLDTEIVVKVWQTGIGSSKSLNCTKENEKYQMECLRLLIAVSSKSMYTLPNAVASLNIQSLTYMTTKLESRVVNGIICSLLNTVLKYNPNAWNLPVSLDLAVVSNDSKKLLVTYALQLLLLLVTYQVPVSASVARNSFRHALSMLHRPDDFQFVHQGLSQVLSQPISGNLTYFQNKEKSLSWAPEMLSLLWELIQCNRRFRRYLIETGSVLDYVVMLIFYAMESKEHSTKHGILRLCVFALQSLSVEPAFAKKLNMQFAYAETLPAVMRVPNFHGSYADFLISSISSIFTTPISRPDAIYAALVAIISNVAAYQSNLARATSSKMIELFTMLSSPTFLLANDQNHHLLSTYLGAINGLLENRLQDNRKFVDVLVGSRARFKALRALTIDGALAEVDRQSRERKEYGYNGSDDQNHSRPGSIDHLRPIYTPTSALTEVPEDSRFSIGDDEEQETGAHDTLSNSVLTRDDTEVSPSHISEKARGKRPAIQISTASRTTSASSLPTVSTISQPFRPSQDWLESWYSTLPLATIFRTINEAKTGGYGAETGSQPYARTDRHQDTKQKDQDRVKHSHSRSVSEVLGSSPDDRSDVKGGQSSKESTVHKESGGTGEEQVVVTTQSLSFQWTTVAMTWYISEIWGRVYVQEAEASQGLGGLYTGTNIVLFRRSSTTQEISLRSPKGAIDAVGASLAQRFSNMSTGKRE